MCELYRHYDESDALLYVGISVSTVARLVGHKSYSQWFDRVTKITIERYATRKEALQAEREAIATEKPLFNVVHGQAVRSKSGFVGLYEAAEILNMKPAVLRAQVQYGNAAVKPVSTTKSGQLQWLRRALENHAAVGAA